MEMCSLGNTKAPRSLFPFIFRRAVRKPHPYRAGPILYRYLYLSLSLYLLIFRSCLYHQVWIPPVDYCSRYCASEVPSFAEAEDIY